LVNIYHMNYNDDFDVQNSEEEVDLDKDPVADEEPAGEEEQY